MNTNLSPALDILYETEAARMEGFRRLCELLSVDPTSTIARILGEREQRLGAFDTSLLQEIAKTVEDHNIKRNITDWPFEHFWGNPYEPRHSKLLGYFIDPDKQHGCDGFLRRTLLEVLETSLMASESLAPVPRRFPADGCHIHVESEDIDLWIERRGDDRKYAIIIENKINWAINQNKQLQRYVESVLAHGFKENEIYVFYLPLTDNKDPDKGDQEWLEEKRVHYKKITFEKHIMGWLNTVLDQPNEWPLAMHQDMHENLSHYRNLIKYLIMKKKEQRMNGEMLKLLEGADKKNALPTWSQVESLFNSATKLKECLESVLRGKLLLNIRSILQQQGGDVWLCLDDDNCRNGDSMEEIKVDSPYDEHFADEVNLCVRADATVSVCFGASPSRFWIGYMRSGSQKKQKEIEPLVLSEAQERLTSPEKFGPWYALAWREDVTYDNCAAKSSAIAGELLEMRNGLVDQLKLKGVRS